MAADGNTTLPGKAAQTETSISGAESQLFPVIVPESTGAISPLATSMINKPDEGTIRVIDVGNTPELHFSFQPSDVKITALDVDIVLIFNDSSKLILPNLAMDLLGTNPPKMLFGGTVVKAQSIVAAIGHVDLVDASPSIHLASPEFLPKKKGGNTNDKDESATGQNGVGGGEPPVPPPPPASGAKSGKTGESEGAKIGDFNSPPVKEVQAGAITAPQGNSAISSPSVIATTKAEVTNNATSYSFDVPVIAKLYQIVDSNPIKTTIGGVTKIQGGSGTSPAATDSSFSAQSAVETLNGTANNDEIWGDSPDYASAGRAGRVVSITPNISSEYTMSTLVVSGIPKGYEIIGATPTGMDSYGNLIYSISSKTKGSSEFQFQLAYTVPETAANSRFYLSLSFKGVKNGTTAEATASSGAYVQISDVVQDSQQITTNSSDGRTVINLSLHPAGNYIDAGAGDDSIHAAAGADSIDGGSGTNWVEYDLSLRGVSVNLKTGLGDFGFATGDRYANIHNILGSTAADTLIGDDFGDTIKGNGGHDSIMGGTGNDQFASDGTGNTIDGGDGYDAIDYSLSSTAITVDISAGTASGGGTSFDVFRNIEKIIASQFSDDLLISGATPTQLDAGAGNDTVYSGPSADTLDGGIGTDLLSYKNSTAAVSVNLATGVVVGGYATGDLIQNFENIAGSGFNDTLIGSTGNNSLFGDAGTDSLIGGGGNDTFSGGAGDDTIIGGTGLNSINGGADNDFIVAGSGTNSIDGGNNVDTLDYSGSTTSLQLKLIDTGYANALLDGGNKIDFVTNIENVIGTNKDDTISGNSSDNSINGGTGDDLLSGGLGNDTLDGGTGTNTVSYAYLGSSVNPYTFEVGGSAAITVTVVPGKVDVIQNIENLVGSDYNDSIIGDERSNTLFGGKGDDTFLGSGGLDSIDGGAGNNTIDYSKKIVNGVLVANTSGVTVDLFGGRGYDFALGDKYSNVQNVVGSGGDDSLLGDAVGNSLSGGAGNDTIDGGAGNDTINGGDGNDILNGGDGNDLVLSWIGVDTLYGDAGDDTLDASAGSSALLSGGDGNDSLFGSVGNDTLSGGAGNDVLDGQAGSADTADYSYLTDPAQSFVLTRTSDTSFVGTASATDIDTLLNIEAVKLGKGINTVSLGDILSGNLTIDGTLGATDSIATGAGNDVLLGGAGNDTLSAGYGTNSINGGAGTGDTIDYGFLNAANGSVSITATGATAFSASGADSGSGTLTDTISNVEVFLGTTGNDTMDMRLATGNLSLAGNGGYNTLTGGSGNDTVSGVGGLANSLSGGAGNGLLMGGNANDTFSGGTGNDTITGGNGNSDTADYSYLDTAGGSVTIIATGATAFSASASLSDIDALSGIEIFKGSAQNDTMDMRLATGNLSLAGGLGSDSFVGGNGKDTIDGGDGRDTASYAYLDGITGVTVTMGGAGNTFLASASTNDQDTLINIEALLLTQYADSVNLSSATADLSLTGRGGADTITGGKGNDTIDGSASTGTQGESIFGGDGNDRIIGGAGANTLDGGSGNDTIDASHGTLAQILNGGDGNDVITAGLGNDTIHGGNNDDSVIGGSGNNYLYGDAGNDTLQAGSAASTLDGGDGDDVLDARAVLSGASLNGGAGNDSLLGGVGNDTFLAGYGTNSIDGGTGISDTIDYTFLNAASGSVSITATGATAFSASGSDTGSGIVSDTVSNVEVFLGTTGNDLMNMRLATGNLSLVGNAGNDSFVGGQGNDTIDGGVGNDSVDYSAATTNVTLTMGADAKTFTAKNATAGSIGTDTLINIENIKLTANGDSVNLATATADLSLTGAGGADTITTGLGNDLIDASASTASVLLNGGAGNDTILGGSGSDSLAGGSGNDLFADGAGPNAVGADTIDGGADFDTVSYSAYTGNLTVTATNSTTFTAGASEKLINIEAIVGGSGNDSFDMTNVTTVNLSLAGGGGNDTFKSGQGSDTFAGGAGNDLYYVNSGTDQIVEDSAAGSGNDTVYAAGTSFNLATNGANVEALYHRDYNGNTLSTAFTGVGNDSDNLIYGGLGSDSLYGGAGNDTFVWTGGSDTVDGGTSTSDTVVFSQSGTTAARLDADETSDKGWIVKLYDALSNLVSTNTLSNIEGLTGTTGNDVFHLGDGATGISVDGAGGSSDRLDYGRITSSATSVSLTLNGYNPVSVSVSSNGAALRTDLVAGIENVTGGAGNDTIVGDGNTNFISGGLGNDSMDGKGGTDTADYSYVQSGAGGLTVSLNLDTAAIAAVSASDTDTLKNFENIIGTVNADCIQGDSANNSISGGDGNDTLAGGAGNDTLDGGLVGGVIGTAVNMVDFAYIDANHTNGTAYKTHSISAISDLVWTATLSGGGDNDSLLNFSAIRLGNGYNTVNLASITHGVTIDGSLGQTDSIATGSGNDSLLGGLGNDSFSGGGGNDTVDGGAGTGDIIDFSWIATGKSITITAANTTSWNYTDSTGAAGQLLNIEVIKCSIPDDHIDPRRSAFFMARSILRDIRSGVRAC